MSDFGLSPTRQSGEGPSRPAQRSARRSVLQWLAACGVLTLAGPALAGSYLDRAALLIAQGKREIEYLHRRFADKELARVISEMAAARLESAARMLVPAEVAQAHPHLLLILEHHRQAAEAASKREVERFLVYRQRALDEEHIFRGVLKQLGWKLPDV
jgi:hypothetical protein